MRLFDADALLRALPDDLPYKGSVRRVLMQAPEVDAVPVVRCRDCKHFRYFGRTTLLINGKHVKAGWCNRRARHEEEYRMPPDGFCSYGERREDKPCE